MKQTNITSRFFHRACALAVSAAALVGLTSCKSPDELAWAERKITQDYTFAGGITVSAADLDKGRVAYINNCYACHGMDGDGKGPASYGYRPPPRDFRRANFKFGAVRSGELPSDEDLMRIVKGGLHGTPMLPWDTPDEELALIIQFIKTFPPPPCDPEKVGEDKCQKDAEKYPEGKPNKWLETYTRGKKKGQPKSVGDPIVVPAEDPWAGKTPEAIAKGAEIYHLKAQCANCHPSYLTRQELSDLKMKVDGKPMTSFRDNMYQSIVLAAKDNPYQVNLMPPDFTMNPIRSVRDEHEMHDMWRLIAAGVGGVMPAWIDGLPPDEIWALAHYIKSLSALRARMNVQARNELWNKLDNQPPWQPPAEEPDPKTVKLEITDEGMKLDGEEIEDDEALVEKLTALIEESPVELDIAVDGTDLSAERLEELTKLAEAAGVKEVRAPKAEDEEEDADEDADDGGDDATAAPAPKDPAPQDPDAKDPKGKTKVPPTPVPLVPKKPAPKAPPAAPKAPAPKAPAPKAPPADNPYD